MSFNAAFLAFAFFGLTAVFPAGKGVPREPLYRTEIRFVFKSFDGDFETVCPHRLLNENSPFDWRVECFRGSNKFAEYTAHIALSQYAMQGPTKLAVELLYWLNGTRLPSEVGSTTWMKFAEMGGLQSVSSSQTVENGTAGLYLEVSANALRPVFVTKSTR